MRALLRGERGRALAWLAAAAWIAIYQARIAGVKGSQAKGAVPDVLLTTGVAIAFFALCGYAAARVLLPAAWRAHLALFCVPLGAACATLALTVLGLAHVPFDVSLALVLAAGAASTALAARRARGAQRATRTRWATEGRQEVSPVAPQGRRPDPFRGRVTHLLVPAGLALLVAAISLIPSFRAGFATVPGQNGDAVLAVGTATFLQHAPPTSVRPDLPLDRVPLQWRSKLPIYYGLAAVSRLAGQDPVTAFAATSGVVLAMFAIGLFLLAAHGLRAPPLVALLAMFLVPLDRIVLYIAIHPYFNQLWALFALPFVLLTGWWFLRAPSGRSLALALLFGALALFTYPLLLPFPAAFLLAAGWRERARARAWWGSVRVPRWGWVLAAVVAVPVAAVLVRGIVEKVGSAGRALLPGGDLSGWAGGTVLPYLEFDRFVGIAAGPLVLIVLVCAVLALRRARRDVGAGLAVMLGGALLAGIYVRARGQGELFWFKDLGFAGPLILLLGVLGLASLRGTRAWRIAGAAGLVLVALALASGAQEELGGTFEQVPRGMLPLRTWDRELPARLTIRNDVPPSGWQLWGWYLMPRHRMSARRPLGGFFPHPPVGRRADLSLVLEGHRPRDAIGPPLRDSGLYQLYRLRPNPWPDVSSRALVYDVKRITF